MSFADACVTVATIPLGEALWLGTVGLFGMGLLGFACGAWWRGGG
jgi:hypothetical protein